MNINKNKILLIVLLSNLTQNLYNGDIANKETASTVETPKTVETANTFETPSTVETPKTVEIANTFETPSTVATPKTVEIVNTFETLKTPNTPAAESTLAAPKPDNTEKIKELNKKLTTKINLLESKQKALDTKQDAYDKNPTEENKKLLDNQVRSCNDIIKEIRDVQTELDKEENTNSYLPLTFVNAYRSIQYTTQDNPKTVIGSALVITGLVGLALYKFLNQPTEELDIDEDSAE